MLSKERIECWDTLHEQENKGALSACGYQETIDFLKLGDVLKKGDVVLEIGVGLGFVTKGLRDNGYAVSGFDISKVGLRRVAEYCDRVYGFDDLKDIPSDYFDVILCNNVVLHIPTPLLYYEMFHFIRILKKGGVLAVKSISTDLMEDTGDDPGLVIVDSRIADRADHTVKCNNSIGCFCRSVPYFNKIIDRCGGVAKMVTDEPCRVWFITGTHVFHITKKY